MNKSNRTMGFVVSHKENEHRIVLLPEDITGIRNKKNLVFEKNYGEKLGIPDSAYQELGCTVLPREEVLKQRIICDPKIGEADYLNSLEKDQTIFGWVHADSNRENMAVLFERKNRIIAWGEMHDENRHCFWENNEIAGEAAIMHAYLLTGRMPYETKVAVIGRGSVAQGSVRILEKLGAEVVIYNRNQEGLFKRELNKYDVVVNAVLWDRKREDHLITKADLKRMKKNSLIIDVSCDLHGGIETSRPSTFEEPIYSVDSVIHYTVDHTPSIFFQTASKAISKEVAKYVDDLVEDNDNEILRGAEVLGY